VHKVGCTAQLAALFKALLVCCKAKLCVISLLLSRFKLRCIVGLHFNVLRQIQHLCVHASRGSLLEFLVRRIGAFASLLSSRFSSVHCSKINTTRSASLRCAASLAAPSKRRCIGCKSLRPVFKYVRQVSSRRMNEWLANSVNNEPTFVRAVLRQLLFHWQAQTQNQPDLWRHSGCLYCFHAICLMQRPAKALQHQIIERAHNTAGKHTSAAATGLLTGLAARGPGPRGVCP
jgi:hypothetical protein